MPVRINTGAFQYRNPETGEYQSIGLLSGGSAPSDETLNHLAKNSAEPYDPATETGYSVGNYCTYDFQLYKCVSPVEAGGEPWDESHWELCSTATEITTTRNQLQKRIGSITVQPLSWVAGTECYTQVVTVRGTDVTPNSMIDLQLSASQIVSLSSDGVQSLLVDNTDGVLTMYAMSAIPSSTMTIQCTVTEVEVGELPVIVPYLTFRERNGSEFDLYGSHTWDGTLEYSTDTETWETWEGESQVSSSVSSENGVLYLRGVGNTVISWFDGDPYGFSFSEDENLQIDCIGNIETLLDYTEVLAGNHPVMSSHCFECLFQGCYQLCSAPELPATTLTEYCYADMFCECTSLETAPQILPATTLTESCYVEMFSDCTSLTTAPELPATTLAVSCYHFMFIGCTSLQTAPELPATTLAQGCYSQMFIGCTSLQTAPELPATTLADYCYYYMFSYCTSLTTAPELPATTLADYCYAYMFAGCTSLETASELPATTLAEDCYESMFSECTSLTTAPELPATTLAESCYASMFSNCTSLYVNTTRTSASQTEFRIPTVGTGTDANNALTNMFFNTSGSLSGTPTINTTYYIGQPS